MLVVSITTPAFALTLPTRGGAGPIVTRNYGTDELGVLPKGKGL